MRGGASECRDLEPKHLDECPEASCGHEIESACVSLMIVELYGLQ